MGFGKILAIISGILTLLTTFALTWLDPGVYNQVYGIGGILNIPDLFGTLGDNIASSAGTGGWIVYIILVVEVLFLLSWLFELIGSKVRFLAILGGFFPFVIGIFLILGAFITSGFIADLVGIIAATAGQGSPLVDNIIPFNLVFADMTLGAVLLTLSGLLGIISGIMPREPTF